MKILISLLLVTSPSPNSFMINIYALIGLKAIGKRLLSDHEKN